MENNIKEFLENLKEIDKVSNNEISEITPPDFDTLFISFVYQKYSKSEILDMQNIWSIYTKAFQECKNSKFAKANYFYTKANEQIQKFKFSDQQLKYLNVYIYPNIAYFEYKQGNYDKGIRLLNQAIQNIDEIEVEYPDAHMVKIQQIHNLARIYFKMGDENKFINISQEILSYLMLSTSSFQNEFGFDEGVLKKCDKQLKYLFIFQVLSEALSFYMLNDLKTDIEETLLKRLQLYKEDNYISDWIDSMNTKEIFEIENDLLKADGTYLSFKMFIFYKLATSFGREIISSNLDKSLIETLKNYQTIHNNREFSLLYNKITETLYKNA